MSLYLMPRCLGLALLGASTAALLAGCGAERGSAAQPIAASAASLQTPTPRPGAGGGELVVPSTGQAVDTSQAVDVVRAEVRGGEADAKTATPPDFLHQHPDESLIDDEPYDLAAVAPAGLSQAASSVPDYNPMTVGKLSLGKQLFYDQRVSLDATVSCASCHDPARGWTDNKKASIGIGDQVGARNSPTVLNTILGKSMFWDGRSPHLEGQAQGPIQNKIEMGDQSYRRIVERLRAIPDYRDQFRRVFGTNVTLDGISKAIACFERTALSGDSAYDQYTLGDDEEAAFAKLTFAQKRGMLLFGLTLREGDPDARGIDPKLRKRANCTTCHLGDNFTDERFHNLGVGFDASTGRYADLGRWVVTAVGTKSKADRGAFKTPTLRDATRTAPYMHDGSEPTLEAVVDFYDRGGIRNPALDRDMAPLNLADGEKADLVAFLRALTGREVKVAVPALPPGPDGTRPDPTDALNHPGRVATAHGPGGSDHLAIER